MVKIGSYIKWYRVNLENFLCSKRMGTAAATYLCNCRKRMKWSFPWLVKKSTFCQRPHDPSREQFLQIPVFRRSLVGSFLHHDRKREVGMAFFSFLNLTNMKRGNGPLFCALRHLETYFRLEPMKQQQNLASINHHLHVCTFRN